MPNALDKLNKTVSGIETTPARSSRKLNLAKRQLQYIYQPLILHSNTYKPELTVDSIKMYINNDHIGRILYSEISSFISSLDEEERKTVSYNLDTLVNYVIDNDVGADVRKVGMKIYDHFQLNLIQFENAKLVSERAIAESITEEKEKLRDEVKRIEREYITILGIFSAIMLAFVGSFTFSTSVLNNISEVSAYTLALIALIIGLVFVVLITVLIDFLRDINDKLIKDSNGNKMMNPVSKFAIVALSFIIIVSFIGNALSNITFPEVITICHQAEVQSDEENTSDLSFE